MSEIEQDVWRTVQAMNRVWTVDRQPDRLAEFFHRDMVAVTPTDRHRIEGRPACVAGWKGFVEAARVTRWVEVDPKVKIHAGGLAVVSYDFDMSFERGGRVIELGGRDTLALVSGKRDAGGSFWTTSRRTRCEASMRASRLRRSSRRAPDSRE